MLGHKVLEVLLESGQAWGAIRPSAEELLIRAGFPQGRLLVASGLPDLTSTIRSIEPDLVINCIGAVKQAAAAQDPVQAILINSLFPHQVAAQCSAIGARLIHVSTDCVFDGANGHYDEAATPDATDLYGRSKLLGEVVDGAHLTLRTSIIGRELVGAHGLVEWFLGERGGSVRGYASARFSGLTTLAFARVIALLAADQPGLSGLHHVAAEPIDKYTLLTMLNAAFRCGTAVERDDSLVIDRSLDGSEFSEKTGIVSPTWEDMIAEIAADSERFGYDLLRNTRPHR